MALLEHELVIEKKQQISVEQDNDHVKSNTIFKNRLSSNANVASPTEWLLPAPEYYSDNESQAQDHFINRGSWGGLWKKNQIFHLQQGWFTYIGFCLPGNCYLLIYCLILKSPFQKQQQLL